MRAQSRLGPDVLSAERARDPRSLFLVLELAQGEEEHEGEQRREQQCEHAPAEARAIQPLRVVARGDREAAPSSTRVRISASSSSPRVARGAPPLAAPLRAPGP